MLILSRRPDERVKIGKDIVVTVLSVKGKQVRLGFTAPDGVSIHREEVHDRIEQGQPMPAKRSDG